MFQPTHKHTKFNKAVLENVKILIRFPLTRSIFRDKAGDCPALWLKRLQKTAFWKTKLDFCTQNYTRFELHQPKSYFVRLCVYKTDFESKMTVFFY